MAKLIGITGGIGTGKSTVCSMLQSFGAKVIDADKISRTILNPGTEAHSQVVEYFGEKILDSALNIDRALLGKIVFEDSKERKELERITHPAIKAEIDRQFSVFAGQGSCIVALEAPLLFEAGMEGTVDEVWVVVCSAAEQLARIMKRGFSAAEAQARIDSQLPLAEKIKQAHQVIDTGVPMQEMRESLRQLWCTLCRCE